MFPILIGFKHFLKRHHRPLGQQAQEPQAPRADQARDHDVVADGAQGQAPVGADPQQRQGGVPGGEQVCGGLDAKAREDLGLEDIKGDNIRKRDEPRPKDCCLFPQASFRARFAFAKNSTN